MIKEVVLEWTEQPSIYYNYIVRYQGNNHGVGLWARLGQDFISNLAEHELL